MTVIFSADVMCDACGNWIGTTVSGPNSKGQNLASRAVKIAKKHGWSRQTNHTYLDVCPDCLKKIHRGELK